MFLSTLHILVAIAFTSTLCWAVLDRQPRLMTAVSAGVWSMIALSGSQVSQHLQGSTEPVTHSAPMIQWVALFFGALSLFAMYSFKNDWVPEPRAHRNDDHFDETNG